MSGHFVQALRLNTTPTPAVIDGVLDQTIDPGHDVETFYSDGQALPTMACVAAILSRLGFTSLKISTLNSLFGVSGYEIDSVSLDAFTVNASATGRGSSGEMFTVSKGVVVPTRLVATQRPGATINYSIVAGGSSGAAPLSVTSGQAVPAVTAANEVYRLIGATLNGSSLGTLLSCEVDFGFDVRQEIGEAEYPNLVHVARRAPRILLKTRKPGALSQVTLTGSSHAVVVTLGKCTLGGLLSANTLTLTTYAQIVTPGTLQGDQAGLASNDILVQPLYDGTHAPIVIGTT